ncbi:PREDICTED: facilitated trehalose transporter Tret1-like isoform X1 [Vollenhovia emeryi]|uniref:facilitated trehalose transporter Tret1-like isoform X1 n=1 Tax=Vollenhovia emeryi TaxID=411798 RepID=UPI0005F44A3D|nr:PREDICTED: facilitated trehalose transporter Tret1-like isoform X1 [Vollenhovia emeryi]
MDPKTEQKIFKQTQWPQWLAGIGTNLLLLQIGMIEMWSSPYYEYLTSPESDIPVTMDEASWIVSILLIGDIIGALSSAVIMHYYGTARAVLMMSLTITASWFFIAVANEVAWLYAARILAGISMGQAFLYVPFYLSEIADPTIRGTLVALATNGLSLGNIMMSTMGAYLRMDVSGIICFVISLVPLIITFWLPNTPHYLIKIKKEDKARASILWYHHDCNVESELQALKLFLEKNKCLPFADVIKEFRNPCVWKAQVLVSILVIYYELSQSYLLYYMETILEDAQVTVIEPSVMVIAVNVTGFVGSLVSMFLIDKFGRRILMIISSLGLTIALICLGVQYQLLDAGYDPTSFQALPIFAVLLFEMSSFIGIIPVPNAVISEVYPPHIKYIASCFTTVVGGLIAFVAMSIYHPLVNLITEKYVFYAYALILLTAVPYSYFCMLETRCKSLQQIQKEWKS